MDTITELKTILQRLEACPQNLVRVELDMFHNALLRDVNLGTLLEVLVVQNEKILGARAANIVANVSTSTWTNLEFANSAPLRAAVGFQVLQSLLQERGEKCGEKVVEIGMHYLKRQRVVHVQVGAADAIEMFSLVFLHPLVSYLGGALGARDQITLLLSRYKQRCEWFRKAALMNIAGVDQGGQVEKRLKGDFLLFLFDSGVVFSIESETPSGGGKVDVLPVLPDVGPLPLEAKVFDDASRNKAYIEAGLQQAADYCGKHNSRCAYLIIYSVAKDTELVLPGTVTAANVIRIPVGSVDVLTVVLNLFRTLPASESHKLKKVPIGIPSLQNG